MFWKKNLTTISKKNIFFWKKTWKLFISRKFSRKPEIFKEKYHISWTSWQFVTPDLDQWAWELTNEQFVTPDLDQWARELTNDQFVTPDLTNEFENPKNDQKSSKNHVLRRVYRFSSIFSDLSSLGALVKIWESFSENWPTPSRTRLTNRSGTDQRPGSWLCRKCFLK